MFIIRENKKVLRDVLIKANRLQKLNCISLCLIDFFTLQLQFF